MYIIGAILLFSAIGCSTENTNENSEVNQETSMKIGFNYSKTNLTGKDVKRGILPVILTHVDITTDLVSGQYDMPVSGNVQIKYPFDIVPDETVGASDEFIIKNFQTGRVLFNAKGMTSSRLLGDTFGVRDHYIVEEKGDITTVFNKYNAMNPLILYGCQTIKNTVAGDNNSIEMNLIPYTGRLISIFKLSDELKGLNYTAKIASYENPYISPATVNKENCAVLYLCGNQVGDGNSIGFLNVTVYDENGEAIYAYQVRQTAVKGESLNTIYTITSDNFPSTNHLQSTIFVPEFKSEAPVDVQI
jgi:hypothetical protein